MTIFLGFAVRRQPTRQSVTLVSLFFWIISVTASVFCLFCCCRVVVVVVVLGGVVHYSICVLPSTFSSPLQVLLFFLGIC